MGSCPMWRLPVFMEGGKHFMGLTALIDSIRTGFGCLLADALCASAEKKAKQNGIDTDAVKECIYGQFGKSIHEHAIKAKETKDGSVD